MRSVVLFCLLTMVGFAGAQTFPPVPKEGYVYDGAELLSDKDEEALNALAKRFFDDTKQPLFVVVVPKIGKDVTLQAYGKSLFERWHQGFGNDQGGLLLLLSKGDRVAHIEIGVDWTEEFGQPTKQILEKEIRPAMALGDYAKAVREGAAALSHLGEIPDGMSGGPSGPPIAAGSSGPSLTPSEPSEESAKADDFLSSVSVRIGAAAAALAGLGLFAYSRLRSKEQ